MFAEGDLGVTPPLGVWDPLGLIESRDMRRYTIMEIKHGRAAMLGFLHVIHIEAGGCFPTEQCLAAPKGLIASLESMPTFAWLQIMLTTCMMESGYFLFEAQTTDAAPGDIGGDAWVRYDDPEAKTFKLNVERQNGRAAMLGVFGCILHELVGVDALYPTGVPHSSSFFGRTALRTRGCSSPTWCRPACLSGSMHPGKPHSPTPAARSTPCTRSTSGLRNQPSSLRWMRR